jgi:hypothetical protein
LRTKYKLYGIDDGENFYVDQLKLDEYLWYLNKRRHFNYELTVEYTKEIYGIDLSDIIMGYPFWEHDKNYFAEYEKQYPRQKEARNAREYFNNYGKRYYEQFMQYAFFDLEKDCLYSPFEKSEVHHIFPLIYGGTNDLKNLIHLNSFNHDILHENPFEDIQECCFKALDYLGTIYCDSRLHEIFVKYDLKKYDSIALVADMLKACIKEEMRLFYEKLSISNN